MKKRIRGIVAIVTVVVLLVLSFLVYELSSTWLSEGWSFWMALAFFVVTTLVFFYNAIKIIPADPPHKGILIVLGKRQKCDFG